MRRETHKKGEIELKIYRFIGMSRKPMGQTVQGVAKSCCQTSKVVELLQKEEKKYINVGSETDHFGKTGWQRYKISYFGWSKKN